MLKFNYPGHWDGVNYKGMYYIHTYPLETAKNELKSVKEVNSCREFFVRSYRHMIAKHDSFTIWARKAYALYSIGRPNEHLFDNWQSDLESASEKGLYIMNSFEKEHKWPRTKLYQVECINKRIPMVFFAGSRRWTTSPYLMSIWSLCVRLGQNNWLPKKLMTLNHENLVRQLAIASKSGRNEDATQLSKTVRHWDSFMTLYPDLFADQNRKYHWDVSHLNGGNDRPEGIYKLIAGTTRYEDLYNKYNDLRRKKS